VDSVDPSGPVSRAVAGGASGSRVGQSRERVALSGSDLDLESSTCCQVPSWLWYRMQVLQVALIW